MPPPLPITIMPLSRRPWCCCCHCPLKLRCYRATLRHLLTCHHPLKCRLVVTMGWLLPHHLLSRHCLLRCRLIVTLPLNAQPSCLPRLVVMSPCRHHCLSMHRLVVASHLILPPSHLPCLVVPSPLVVPPPLNMLLLHLIETGAHGGGGEYGGGGRQELLCPPRWQQRPSTPSSLARQYHRAAVFLAACPTHRAGPGLARMRLGANPASSLVTILVAPNIHGISVLWEDGIASLCRHCRRLPLMA